ncbi:MAG: hypothetical protein U0N51_08130 [Clostridia bacterium]|nr:MAG TPA: hypothetical protein [Bacteriophage sp.]
MSCKKIGRLGVLLTCVIIVCHRTMPKKQKNNDNTPTKAIVIVISTRRFRLQDIIS